MTSIRNFITLLITLVSINIASAQQGQIPAEERASNRTIKMKQELQLNEEQVKKVQDINLSYVVAIENLKKNKANQQEIDAQDQVYLKQLQGVLTAEQYRRVEIRYLKKKADRKN